MKRSMVTVSMWALASLFAWADESVTLPPEQPLVLANAPDSAELEKRLQSLSWPQFRAVVMAVPKLKAEVDAYGTFGWQYVQARYRTYRWQKSINKLDAVQQRQLSDLIEEARAGRLTVQAGS